MSDLIFWYTGATVWSVIAIILAVCIPFAMLIGVLRAWATTERYAATYLMCKRLMIDRDREELMRVRSAFKNLAWLAECDDDGEMMNGKDAMRFMKAIVQHIEGHAETPA